MEEKNYYIVNLDTNKYYASLESGVVNYSDKKEDAKILTAANVGNELMKIRLLGELVEHKEV